ncbi:MAG: helix-turn-helix domain-containing protein [Simkania negevensis]|nr:helix-turn-helix domain-containing protein [Simkania negevensis]
MNEQLEELGEILKSKRKELNLSLKEVESSLSIQESYLKAIEEGRAEGILSPVYTMGFLKQYVNFLGLEGDTLAKTYPDAFNLKSAKHEFSYGIGTLEPRGSVGGGVKWLPSLIWATLSVVILILAYYFAKYLGVLN